METNETVEAIEAQARRKAAKRAIRKYNRGYRSYAPLRVEYGGSMFIVHADGTVYGESQNRSHKCILRIEAGPLTEAVLQAALQ